MNQDFYYEKKEDTDTIQKKLRTSTCSVLWVTQQGRYEGLVWGCLILNIRSKGKVESNWLLPLENMKPDRAIQIFCNLNRSNNSYSIFGENGKEKV